MEHSGARVLYVDPELDEALAGVTAEHRFVLGDDDDLYAAEGVEPREWEPDESATACINYTSGTTARPKGVQITHRNIWVNAVTFAMHAAVTDRDVYLHTLADVPRQRLGDAVRDDGPGRAAGGAPQGRRRRDPAPGRGARRHGHVRRAGRGRRGARRRRRLGRRDPRTGHGCGSSARVRRRRRRRSCGSRRSWAGSSSRSTGSPRPRRCSPFNRTRAEWDGLSAEERAGKLSVPAPRPSAYASRPSRGRGARPVQRGARGLLGAAGGVGEGVGRRLVPHRRRRRDRRPTATSRSATARRT